MILYLDHIHDFTKSIPYTTIGPGWYLLAGEVFYGPYNTRDEAKNAYPMYCYSFFRES